MASSEQFEEHEGQHDEGPKEAVVTTPGLMPTETKTSLHMQWASSCAIMASATGELMSRCRCSAPCVFPWPVGAIACIARNLGSPLRRHTSKGLSCSITLLISSYRRMLLITNPDDKMSNQYEYQDEASSFKQGRSPVVKLVFCLRKRPDLSDDEFHRYWLEEHGNLVRKLAPSLKIQRYVQSHTVRPELNDSIRQIRGMEKPHDGIAELWWNSMDDYREAYGSEEGREADAALKADEEKFIDLASSTLWFCEEHTLFEV